jgi:hypothetical protein
MIDEMPVGAEPAAPVVGRLADQLFDRALHQGCKPFVAGRAREFRGIVVELDGRAKCAELPSDRNALALRPAQLLTTIPQYESRYTSSSLPVDRTMDG